MDDETEALDALTDGLALTDFLATFLTVAFAVVVFRAGEALAPDVFLTEAVVFFATATFFAGLALTAFFFGEDLFALVVGMRKIVLGIG